MEKLPFKKRIIFFCVEYIGTFLIRLIYLTCRVKFSDTKLSDETCVVVFWHGRLAMMPFAYLRYWKRYYGEKRKVKVIISDHKDGEIITRVISHFGIGAIRGSSSKGAVRALMNAFSEIKNGVDVIITPDGPRGPRHSVADGAVTIAQKKNLKIYALNYEASRFWEFRSWDKMVLPKPFSRINYSLSEPLDIAGLGLEEAKEKIANLLFAQAEKDKNFDF
ncbi:MULTISPECIES: lysophospholipid acyltransferase family protein [unclassified Campylobacter]|uniref:lysophospholipid acyltransferase family protein n=1 Tax=unclassified Campylobacter TaxID=2593542 RepID=UPI0022E9EFD1|nr:MULTISPECIES: lysophospholipid acyltransferase family protein [unclassified Campylobacter]MDA3048817.1 lysophospholipid acyltransferase family protein [Campylobacter sp. JMF_15 NE4]MDA3050472.1 lysophospholipid acyltransferase family protein [Campylobacter sp. JMF_02 ED1]MDA3055065.1 lysophospholipid acyltransferase family protein [Campylobacter sp. VBCF_07 NA4]MDA3060567.1 lysophospholipid acyltransferase family protein [Campylobacter sp. VBCF_02 NA5]MDA3070167.1 lysophospholipid acyltrans